MKCDDDVLYNITDLHQIILQHFTNKFKHSVNFILGSCTRNGRVRRDGKWSLSKEVFPADRFPMYCLGGNYVLSKPVIPLLLNQTKTTPTIHIEDAYIGLLAHKVGNVDLVNIPRWFLNWHTKPEEFRKYHVVHMKQQNISTMEKLWTYVYNSTI